MCTGIELLMVASTGMSVMGQLSQGQAQKDMYAAQAQATVNDAAYRSDAATAQAEKIRKAGKAQIGEANASLAASGVKLGQGSALEVKKSIIQNSEEDALSAILSGKRTVAAADKEASMLNQAGDNAVTNSYMGAAGTVLSAGGNYMRGGWKMSAKAGG